MSPIQQTFYRQKLLKLALFFLLLLSQNLSFSKTDTDSLTGVYQSHPDTSNQSSIHFIQLPQKYHLVEVVQLDGEVVLYQESISRIDIRNLSSGVYILRAKNNGQHLYQTKFIKN
ncbi:MAG: T9SS type A sorting domain-containing protein [Flavobacteriales bacterium]|nr:T9SS type A sorting domain-containing protein [Flavobacteriales bacterium]